MTVSEAVGRANLRVAKNKISGAIQDDILTALGEAEKECEAAYENFLTQQDSKEEAAFWWAVVNHQAAHARYSALEKALNIVSTHRARI